MNKVELLTLAQQKANANGLPDVLVCSIIEQESGWNTFAIRYEPAFFERYIVPLNLGQPTEEHSRAFSWGLMQVMGQVAREHGFKGFLSLLCDPEQGLEIGCKVFAAKLDAARGEVDRALLLWNGGGAPEYPKQVMARMAKYQHPADLSLQGDA
jgi:soluble lytic murein transglycosylase-like protein